MDAPITEVRPSESDARVELTEEWTAEAAIAAWRKRHGVSEPQLRPEPLLAAGELHGVMPPS
jgi:hypothetical protein